MPDAQYALGKREWLARAADAGSTQAQLDAAQLVLGREPDDDAGSTDSGAEYTRAMAWLEAAARAGQADATLALGRERLARADGRDDYQAAREWLERTRRASDEGRALKDHAPRHAAYLLGYMRFNGMGTRADVAPAVELFREALGEDTAEYARLGNRHRYGQDGFFMDPALALAWYTLAAEVDAEQGGDLQEVGADVGPHDRARANALLQAWRGGQR